MRKFIVQENRVYNQEIELDVPDDATDEEIYDKFDEMGQLEWDTDDWTFMSLHIKHPEPYIVYEIIEDEDGQEDERVFHICSQRSK